MSSRRRAALSRLASRLITVIIGLRYVGITHRIKHFQRRLAFLRRLGIMPQPRRA